MNASRLLSRCRWPLLLLPLLAACSEIEGTDRARQAATTCPEAVFLNSRGEPVGVTSRKIRYCWPGMANCFCDAWGDCYALSGYVACAPPTADAGADATVDAAADATADAATDRVDAADAAYCPEAVRLNARNEPVGVTSGKIRYCWPGMTGCVCDAWGDCYAGAGYVACTPPPATDAAVDSAADAASDAATDRADVAADAALCPEAVFLNSRNEPVGVTSRKIRYCWPGMTGCTCDAWGDCYAGAGYVACTPPPATDAGADAAADSASDAAADRASDTTSGGVCPEMVYRNTRNEPVGVTSGKIRYCWPGMTGCSCDAWGDCYAGAGYVACTPPPPPPTGPASTTPAPPTDPVTYTGTLSTTLGQRTNTITVAGYARTVYSYVPTNRVARPPLVIAYHGTDLWGDQMLANMGALNFAEQNGVVVLAPDARYQDAAHADFNRPAGNARYWETAYNTNPDTNPDLLLTRALIKEAQRALNIDIDRVYVVGFSNGGFMALTAAVTLRQRIAGFAESSAGMVPCATRPDCAFRGTALSCSTLRTQSGYCSCSGADKPIALPATGGRPGFLWHAPEDTVVSVYYTCTLDARMTSLNIPHRVQLWSGEHYMTSTFMPNAWSYLRSYIR